jgi:hypothetical protein
MIIPTVKDLEAINYFRHEGSPDWDPIDEIQTDFDSEKGYADFLVICRSADNSTVIGIELTQRGHNGDTINEVYEVKEVTTTKWVRK